MPEEELIEYKYALDACTKRIDYRMTACSDNLQELICGYIDWIRSRGLSQNRMWFSDVFEIQSNRRIAKLKITEDGKNCELLSVDPAKEKVPYERKIPLWARFWVLFWNIHDKFQKNGESSES